MSPTITTKEDRQRYFSRFFVAFLEYTFSMSGHINGVIYKGIYTLGFTMCKLVALKGVPAFIRGFSYKKMAVFTLEDEQIVWTDKSSQTHKSSDVKAGRTNFQTTLSFEFVRLFVRL